MILLKKKGGPGNLLHLILMIIGEISNVIMIMMQINDAMSL